ncbi:MAG: hypothetical protein R3E36_07460 [Nitrosomonas sp.]|nr:hypothetical protein [Nitrosomonas sp.]
MNGLDQEEQELLQAFEAGELRQVADFAERKQRHQEYAEAMFRKDARINIRLSSRDLRALQKKALAEGIPYQTLVASILHKYVEGRLHEER